MKIKYKFATETVEIEVADDWGNLVIDLDRQEYNNDHTETRRHVSYDALDFDGDALAVEDPALTAYTEKDALWEAIEQLTPQPAVHHPCLLFRRPYLYRDRPGAGRGCIQCNPCCRAGEKNFEKISVTPAKNDLSRGLVVKGNTKHPFGKDESDET